MLPPSKFFLFAPKNMPIIIYTLPGCPWCKKAKAKMRRKKKPFREVTYTQSGGKMHNGKYAPSFPQIFVNGRNRGGYDKMDSWCK